MQKERPVSFQAEALTLEGWIAAPEHAETAAVICHPHPQYGGDMDNPVVTGAAAHLQRAGIATLRFNFRGTGNSEGSYANGVGEADDARAAVALLQDVTHATRIVLAGYSFGAMVALKAGYDHVDVAQLIAIAPPLPMMDASFLRSCTKPMLFMLGDRDQYCPYSRLEQFAATLTGPAQLHRLSGEDHFLAGADDEIGRTIVQFVRSGAASAT